jgi:hypothetical protein
MERLLMSADQVRRNREFRLELLLLGMALGRAGDRERICESIEFDKLRSPMAAKCFQAVQSRDSFDIEVAKGVFKQFGFEVSDNICDSLIAQVNLNNARRELQTCIDLMQVKPDTDISQAIADVEACVLKLKDVIQEKEALV